MVSSSSPLRYSLSLSLSRPPMEQEREMVGDGGARKLNAFRLTLANALGLALALPLVALGAALAVQQKTAYCITFIEKPLISMGLLLAFVSIAGICSALTRLEWLHVAHTVSLILLVLLLFCFAIFSVEITSGGSGHSPNEATPSPPLPPPLPLLMPLRSMCLVITPNGCVTKWTESMNGKRSPLACNAVALVSLIMAPIPYYSTVPHSHPSRKL